MSGESIFESNSRALATEDAWLSGVHPKHGHGWIIPSPGVPFSWLTSERAWVLWRRWRRIVGWSGFAGLLGRLHGGAP